MSDADFDGDESNLYAPQSEGVRREVVALMATKDFLPNPFKYVGKDVVLEIMYKMDDLSLLNFCNTNNQRDSEGVLYCNNETFWENRFYEKFPSYGYFKTIKNVDRSWKKIYSFINSIKDNPQKNDILTDLIKGGYENLDLIKMFVYFSGSKSWRNIATDLFDMYGIDEKLKKEIMRRGGLDAPLLNDEPFLINDKFNETGIKDLPLDIRRKISLDLSPGDLVSLCVSSKDVFYKGICNDNKFWRLKIENDYPEIMEYYRKSNLILKNPKNTYIRTFSKISKIFEDEIKRFNKYVYNSSVGLYEFLSVIFKEFRKKMLYKNSKDFYNNLDYLMEKHKNLYNISEEEIRYFKTNFPSMLRETPLFAIYGARFIKE